MNHLNSQIINQMRKSHPEIAQEFWNADHPTFQKLLIKHRQLWNKCKNV